MPSTDILQVSTARLCEEIQAAARWQRNANLMVVYRSYYLRATAEDMLYTCLTQKNWSVRRIRINAKHYDPIEIIAKEKQPEKDVFFISRLRWGGGFQGKNAYRALNLRREDFITGRIKAVFWLSGEEARRLARQAPDFWAFRHLLIDLYHVLPQGSIRIESAASWLDDHSGRAAAQMDAIRRQAEAGRLEQAAAQLEALLAENPPKSRQAILWNNLGVIRQKQRQPAAALAAWQAAHRLLPNHPQIARNRALIAIQTGDYQTALDTAEALSTATKDVLAQETAGEIHYWLGNLDDALKIYHRANRLTPKKAEILCQLAKIYQAMGRPDSALTHARQAVQAAPDNLEALHLLARLYARAGRLPKALAIYRQALEIAPADSESLDFIQSHTPVKRHVSA